MVQDYKKYLRHKKLTILIVSIALLIAVMWAIMAGSANLDIHDVFLSLIGKGSTRANIIVGDIRLPRILTAILVGAILGVAGSVMQNVLRNPLASASTLGVSQGAAFGATVGIILFGAGIQNSASALSAVEINNPYIVTICAFIGGSISAMVILMLAKLKNIGSQGLILTGVALSALFSGGTTLIQYFADDVKVAAVVFWTFGDLGRTSKSENLYLCVVFLLAFCYFYWHRWDYNALESGHHTAKSLGVSVHRLILVSMVVASLISAVAVAFVGIISFIGLVAPHIMRPFVGNDYRYLLPASAIAGSLLLVVADTVGRIVVAPIILPIGAITSFLGAPVFLYLLFKGDRKHD